MSLSYEDLRRGRPSRFGYRVVEMTKGRSVIDWTPSEELRNPVGFVHGGYVGLIIDDTCGTAVSAMLGEIQAFPTASIHIDFLRGIPVGKKARCVGLVVRAGRRLTVADASITDGAGQLLARGTCTFALDLSDSDLVGFTALGPGDRAP